MNPLRRYAPSTGRGRTSIGAARVAQIENVVVRLTQRASRVHSVLAMYYVPDLGPRHNRWPVTELRNKKKSNPIIVESVVRPTLVRTPPAVVPLLLLHVRPAADGQRAIVSGNCVYGKEDGRDAKMKSNAVSFFFFFSPFLSSNLPHREDMSADCMSGTSV